MDNWIYLCRILRTNSNKTFHTLSNGHINTTYRSIILLTWNVGSLYLLNLFLDKNVFFPHLPLPLCNCVIW